MRVLLTNCYQSKSVFSEYQIFPLGLAYIARALDQHEVICFDAAVAQEPIADLDRIVDQFQPEVVGLSLRNIDTAQSYDVVSYWPSFVQTVRHLRKTCPDAILVVGGAGFSLFAQAVMQELGELDFGVYLEGEESFPELLSNLDHPEKVRGVFYRRDQQVHFSGAREPVDLDSLPMPRWDLFDLAPYKGLTGMGVQTKRGCVFDCLYCSYPFLTGHELRLRPPEKVGEEIEILNRQYGVQEIFIADNIFNFPPSHAQAICQEIIRRKVNVRWTAWFDENSITSDLVKLAQEAGCFQFSFSPDGYNGTSLRVLGKRASRKGLETTYRLLNETQHASFRCDFIWNHPGTGWREMRDLSGLLFRLALMRNVNGIAVTTMRILPHTRLHQIAIKEGRVKVDDPLLLPVFYDPFPWRLFSAPMNLLERFHRVSRSRIGRLLRAI